MIVQWILTSQKRRVAYAQESWFTGKYEILGSSQKFLVSYILKNCHKSKVGWRNAMKSYATLTNRMSLINLKINNRWSENINNMDQILTASNFRQVCQWSQSFWDLYPVDWNTSSCMCKWDRYFFIPYALASSNQWGKCHAEELHHSSSITATYHLGARSWRVHHRIIWQASPWGK